MARRPPHDPLRIDQGVLFGDSPLDRALAVVANQPAVAEDVAIASQLPSTLRLGTSSWAFPGWRGLLFSDNARAIDLARCGLAAYARHPLLRTVALDRAFYSLLGRTEASELAALVPAGFRFVIKAHQSVTRPDADERGGTFGKTSEPSGKSFENPRFLDATFARDFVIAPAVEGLADRIGPIVFQFLPLDLTTSGRHGGAHRLLDRLESFTNSLPVGPLYAIEVRNRELLARPWALRYAAILRGANVSHGFAVHPTLPTIAEQATALSEGGWPALQQPALLVRWLLGHSQGYEAASERYQPFDRLVDLDAGALADIAALIAEAASADFAAWVIVNNKAEGCAPLTVRRLAALVAAHRR
ncbi:MAG: DUF72 domain-containing protein [Phycisphaerae bacterium]|nr:DUF72 domain-containing protein [Phycisphaerae bacterium]